MSLASRIFPSVLLSLVVSFADSGAQIPPGLSMPPGAPSRPTLMSIDVPPKTSAPFSATVVTEWTRRTADGTNVTLRNHRLIARDGSGRVFQERRIFTDDGDKVVTPLSALEYVDPTQYELYSCNPAVHGYLETFYGRVVFDLPAETAVDGKTHEGTIKRQDLGQKTIEGIEAVGSREVLTVNYDSRRLYPVLTPTTREFWFSPQLDLNLVTERFGVGGVAEKFWVESIKIGEPDPRLFQLPVDYRVVRIADRSHPTFSVSVILTSTMQAWKVLLPLVSKVLFWTTMVLTSTLLVIILYVFFGRKVRQG
jgi:hypothetical protein